jgi:hypothetical protein
MSKASWHYIFGLDAFHLSSHNEGGIATPVARTACEACAESLLRIRDNQFDLCFSGVEHTGDLPSSGSLNSSPDFGNVLETRTGSPTSNRQKSCPSTLENPDAHLPLRSLSTNPHFAKSEVSVAPKRIISATCRVAEGLKGCNKRTPLVAYLVRLS